MFLNGKLIKLWNSSIFHNIIKQFQLSKEIFVREGKGWKSGWSSGPQAALHLKQDWFSYRYHYMGSWTLPQTICKYSLLCRQEMMILYAKTFQKHNSLSKSSKWTDTKWTNLSVIRQIKFWNSFLRSHGCHILYKKRRGTVQPGIGPQIKSLPLMVWGSISPYNIDCLLWKGTISAEGYA